MGCPGLLGDDCVVPARDIYRKVYAEGLIDTMRVGDSVHFTIVQPWIDTAYDRILIPAGVIDFRQTERPWDNGTAIYVWYAPTGAVDDQLYDHYGIYPNHVTPKVGEWKLFRGGGGVFKGDSTSTEWTAKISFVLPRAGRYHISFVWGRSYTHREGQPIIRAQGLISECDEVYGIKHLRMNYQYNSTMAAELEAISDIKLRLRDYWEEATTIIHVLE